MSSVCLYVCMSQCLCQCPIENDFRQTYRQTYRHTDIQTYVQTYSIQTDLQTDIQTHACLSVSICLSVCLSVEDCTLHTVWRPNVVPDKLPTRSLRSLTSKARGPGPPGRPTAQTRGRSPPWFDGGGKKRMEMVWKRENLHVSFFFLERTCNRKRKKTAVEMCCVGFEWVLSCFRSFWVELRMFFSFFMTMVNCGQKKGPMCYQSSQLLSVLVVLWCFMVFSGVLRCFWVSEFFQKVVVKNFDQKKVISHCALQTHPLSGSE